MHNLVTIIEDSEDLRVLTSILLTSKLGVECLTFGSLADLQAHANEALSGAVAVIDINLGPDQPDGLEVYHWLCNHHFKGNVFFLTGHARSNPMVARACKTGVAVLEKPIENERFVQIVQGAMAGGGSGA